MKQNIRARYTNKTTTHNQTEAAAETRRCSAKPLCEEKMDFQKSWLITRKHLEKARQLLPVPIVQGDRVETIEAYQEFLDHNELECALDQLEGLGEANSCPQEFWQELKLAAENMGLTDRPWPVIDISVKDK